MPINEKSGIEGVHLVEENPDCWHFLRSTDEKRLGTVVRDPGSKTWVARAGEPSAILGEWPLSDSAFEAVRSYLNAG